MPAVTWVLVASSVIGTDRADTRTLHFNVIMRRGGGGGRGTEVGGEGDYIPIATLSPPE